MQYESKAPTAKSDRKCSPLTKCKKDIQYESKMRPTRISDRICTTRTQIDTDNQFESVKPTATSNRQCQAYKKSCPEGQWLDFGSPTKDRECKDYTTSCAGSFYLDESTKSSTADATCLPKKPHGDKCTGGNVCISGNCVNGTCACKEGHYCPDLREVFQEIIDQPVLLGFGKTCTSADQCASGNCNQGTCCNKGFNDPQCKTCGSNGWCSKCKDGHSWQTNGGRTGCLPTPRPNVSTVPQTPATITRNDPKPDLVCTGRTKKVCRNGKCFCKELLGLSISE